MQSSSMGMWRGILVTPPGPADIAFAFLADELWFWNDEDGHDTPLTRQADDDMLALFQATWVASRP